MATTQITNDVIKDATITAAKLAPGVLDGAGGVDWQSQIQSANFNAVAGKGYFVNTSSASITVTMPSSPSLGDTVNVIDYAGNSATNALIITSSNKILGSDEDRQISTNFGSAQLLYSDATYGWQITYGNKESTADGPIFAHALVIGGGGGGGWGQDNTQSGNNRNFGGGGGGAGEFLDKTSVKLQTGKAYRVKVGAGGASDNNGGNSIFKSNADQVGDFVFDFECTGGGRGGGKYTAQQSGGGAGKARTTGGTASGNETSEGGLFNDGGDGSTPDFTYVLNNRTGGGGGAGAAGGNGVDSGACGDGGAGYQSSVTGTATYYAGGGGGGGYVTDANKGSGGVGGGGAGGWSQGGYASGVAGTDGTGSGGGGQRNHNSGGATGGDGVVIIKFPAALNITIGGNLSATTDSASVSGFKITTFTSGEDDISFSN